MAQEQKRDQTVRLPNPSAQPFVAALKTVRFFAVLFFWVAMVCVLAHVVAFVLTEWVGLYDASADAAVDAPAEEATVRAPAPTGGLLASAAVAAEPGELFPNVKPEQTAGTPAGEESRETPEPPAPETPPEAPPAGPAEPATGQQAASEGPGELSAEQRRSRAHYYRNLTASVLGPARVVGVLASILLAVTLFLYLQIALLGRLGGIRQLTRALFLLLLFLVTVLPWGTVFEGVPACALFNFEQLLAEHAAGRASAAPLEAAEYYGQYFIFPAVAVLLLALSGIQFAGGYGKSVLANE